MNTHKLPGQRMRSIYEQVPMAEYYWILGHLSLLLSRLKHIIPEKASWERMQAFIFLKIPSTVVELFHNPHPIFHRFSTTPSPPHGNLGLGTEFGVRIISRGSLTYPWLIQTFAITNKWVFTEKLVLVAVLFMFVCGKTVSSLSILRERFSYIRPRQTLLHN